MGAYEHEGLRVDVDQGVAFVTLAHPPVNLFDAVLIGSLGNLAGELADDAEVGAVRGRVHFVNGERRRTTSWIFLERSEREIQERFGEFSAVELWHFVAALDG